MTLTRTSGVRDNRVIEFEEGRLIAWMPGDAGAEPAGHLWRWQLEPLDGSRTLVTQTYDYGAVAGGAGAEAQARPVDDDGQSPGVARPARGAGRGIDLRPGPLLVPSSVSRRSRRRS